MLCVCPVQTQDLLELLKRVHMPLPATAHLEDLNDEFLTRREPLNLSPYARDVAVQWLQACGKQFGLPRGLPALAQFQSAKLLDFILRNFSELADKLLKQSNADGESALYVAIVNADVDSVAVLLKHGAGTSKYLNPDVSIVAAIPGTLSRGMPVFKCLVDGGCLRLHGPWIGRESANHVTHCPLLDDLMSFGFPDMFVEYALDKGADLFAVHNGDQTPLHTAMYCGYLPCLVAKVPGLLQRPEAAAAAGSVFERMRLVGNAQETLVTKPELRDWALPIVLDRLASLEGRPLAADMPLHVNFSALICGITKRSEVLALKAKVEALGDCLPSRTRCAVANLVARLAPPAPQVAVYVSPLSPPPRTTGTAKRGRDEDMVVISDSESESDEDEDAAEDARVTKVLKALGVHA
jgi:hypothetical protein